MTQFRFTFDPAFMTSAEPFVSEPYGSQEAAEGAMSLVANYTLHLHELNLMQDLTNYGFIERSDCGGPWQTIEEDDL